MKCDRMVQIVVDERCRYYVFYTDENGKWMKYLVITAGRPKKIYTMAEFDRIRTEFCGCERKELLFYYESAMMELWSVA